MYDVVANGFIALVILAVVGLVIAIVTLAGLSAEMCLLGIFHLEKCYLHFPGVTGCRTLSPMVLLSRPS